MAGGPPRDRQIVRPCWCAPCSRSWHCQASSLLIPALIGKRELSAAGDFNVGGIAPLLAGFTLLLWCVYDFYVAGKGTLAPWSPPRHLVATYAVFVLLGFHLRVLFR